MWQKEKKLYTFILIILSFCQVENVEVIYAINAGGNEHTDVYGIHYNADTLHNKIGVASSYGKSLIIRRVPQSDQILYQTERYHHETFGYDIPIEGDGQYVLVLKFSEVYFKSSNEKVFDVSLNREHLIISELDIFDKVGLAVAHDEYIPFSVLNNNVIFRNEKSEIQNGKIRVDFIKGFKDNPKINAIILFKSTKEDINLMEAIPKLPPLPEPEEYQPDKEEEFEESTDSLLRKFGNPPAPSPYTTDTLNMFFPIFVSVLTFMSLMFCLCKM